MKFGSGKQVVLELLRELSEKKVKSSELEFVSKKVRAALLMQGSSSEENIKFVKRLCWAQELDESGNVERQGLATMDGLMVSDIVEEIFLCPQLLSHLNKEFPALSEKDFEAIEFGVFVLLSSLQMFIDLLEVEQEFDKEAAEKAVAIWVDKLGV